MHPAMSVPLGAIDTSGNAQLSFKTIRGRLELIMGIEESPRNLSVLDRFVNATTAPTPVCRDNHNLR